jgi:hypothetical protein
VLVEIVEILSSVGAEGIRFLPCLGRCSGGLICFSNACQNALLFEKKKSYDPEKYKIMLSENGSQFTTKKIPTKMNYSIYHINNLITFEYKKIIMELLVYNTHGDFLGHFG